MARSSAHLETEIKLPLDTAVAGRRLLARLGFSIAKPRVLESNTLFDTADSRLRRTSNLLRLRQAGPVHTLAFKGPPSLGKHKSRQEVESELADPAAIADILRHLGLTPVFRYEKYRTEYGKPDQRGKVMLDETPIGCFLELEGPPRWIDRTARELGYSDADYITASYGSLYLAHCASHGLEPGHMVFSK